VSATSHSGGVRATAVLRFRNISTFVACWTGRSLGFSPLRTRALDPGRAGVPAAQGRRVRTTSKKALKPLLLWFWCAQRNGWQWCITDTADNLASANSLIKAGYTQLRSAKMRKISRR